MMCYDLSSDDSDSQYIYIYIYLYLQIISVYLLFCRVVFAFEIRGSEGEVVAVVFTILLEGVALLNEFLAKLTFFFS